MNTDPWVPDARFGTDLILQKRIATGGMAEIYLANKLGPGGFEKKVVVKRILPQYAHDPQFLSMFLQEARLAAQLQHPNIVQVYDFGKTQDTYYLIMEYVPGKDLREIREASRQMQAPFPVAFLLEVGIAVCRALEYAHTLPGPAGIPLGVVHRDISPSNILISDSGEVKLLDFGIARCRDIGTRTTAHLLKGKIPYMSPEQLSSRPLDGRSDLYALGVVLHELSTGTLPPRTGKPLAGRMPSRTRLPRRLGGIISRVLSEEPSCRFKGALEMRKALEACRRPIKGKGSTAETLAAYVSRLNQMQLETNLSPRPVSNFDLGSGGVGSRPGTEGGEGEKGVLRFRSVARTLRRPLLHMFPFLVLLAAFGLWLRESRPRDKQGDRGFPAARDRIVLTVPEGLQTPLPSGDGEMDTARQEEDPSPPALKEAAKKKTVSVAAHRPASLDIRSVPPAAEIWINGRRHAEKTPLVLRELDPDQPLEIRLVRPDHKPWQERLTAGSLKGAPLHVALEPLGASMHLGSTPAGADVLVNGTPIGKRTPAQLDALPLRTPLEIELRKAGFRNWSGRFSLGPGDLKRVEVPLEEAFGGVRIHTVPWTDVYLDGEKLGKTPLQYDRVPAGPHRLTLLNAEAGINESCHIDIAAGETLKRNLSYLGTLKVISQEPFAVYIDDRYHGTTPCEDIRLPAGHYSVVLRSTSGAREQRFKVQVEQGKTAVLSPPS